jgi:glyoxylase-like metal-dependent hydrolase (beta-lactamase superfamily II)
MKITLSGPRERLPRIEWRAITTAWLLAVAFPAAAALHKPAPDAAQPPLEILKVQGNVYMITGAGGNITAQVGEDGIVLVDTGLAERSSQVIQALHQLSSKPLRFIINTHAHADHTGGNEALSKIGKFVGDRTEPEASYAAIFAHENVSTSMQAPPDGTPAAASLALPTDTFFTASMDFSFNNEALQIIHVPIAHTDGDSIVYFRHSDVVSTGDVFITTGFPYIDLPRGGTINGIINALNLIIDITIPLDKEEGGTLVIPGHGRICDEADVVNYRDMLTIIRDRIQDSINKGMKLEQVKASRPTRGYDARWGTDKGAWTTDKFVEAAYRSLHTSPIVGSARP